MDDIFEDAGKILDNNKESAEALGYKVRKTRRVKKKVVVANKKCKICYGRGIKSLSLPSKYGPKGLKDVYCHCVSQKEIEIDEPVDS